MKYFNMLLTTGLLVTSITACENSYYYPDSSSHRTRGGYVERGTYGESRHESAPRVSTTSGYMHNRSDQRSHGGYIERDSY